MTRFAVPTARIAGSVAVAALLVSLALAGSAVADSADRAHPRPDDDTTTTTATESGSQTETPARVAADDSDVLVVGGGFLAGGLLVALGVAIGRWTR